MCVRVCFHFIFVFASVLSNVMMCWLDAVSVFSCIFACVRMSMSEDGCFCQRCIVSISIRLPCVLSPAQPDCCKVRITLPVIDAIQANIAYSCWLGCIYVNKCGILQSLQLQTSLTCVVVLMSPGKSFSLPPPHPLRKPFTLVNTLMPHCFTCTKLQESLSWSNWFCHGCTVGAKSNLYSEVRSELACTLAADWCVNNPCCYRDGKLSCTASPLSSNLCL